MRLASAALRGQLRTLCPLALVFLAVGLSVSMSYPFLTLFLTEGAVRNFDDAQSCATERFGALFRHLLERDVYLPPSQFEALFPSTAHGEEEIEHIVAAVESFGH